MSTEQLRNELRESIRCSLFDEQDTDDIMADVDRYATAFSSPSPLQGVEPTDEQIEKFVLKVMEQDPKKAASWMTLVAGRECIKANATDLEMTLEADMPDGKRYKLVNKIEIFDLAEPMPKVEGVEEAAVKYAEDKSSSPVFREAHISDFKAGAEYAFQFQAQSKGVELNYGYLCELDGEKVFVVAENIAASFDVLKEIGGKYSLLKSSSIKILKPTTNE